MKARALLVAIASVFASCVGFSPHSSPASITDVEIAEYKWAMKKGCTDQGISKGDDPDKVRAFCGCVADSLNQSMSHEEWQRAVYAAQNKQDREEMRAIGPHLEIKACKNGT